MLHTVRRLVHRAPELVHRYCLCCARTSVLISAVTHFSFVGADIKEAVFWGSECLPSPLRRRTHAGYKGYIVSGSDCGRVFIWDRASTKLVATLDGDFDVLNCVQVLRATRAFVVTPPASLTVPCLCAQPHPYRPWLATSGIESVVRVWMPGDSSTEGSAASARSAVRVGSRAGTGTRAGVRPVECACVVIPPSRLQLASLRCKTT